MSKPTILAYEFVKSVPKNLEEWTLYVSMDYATVAHKCCCGCGREVVTPLSPTDWKLIYDGESISLTPSIGNWSYQCRSHYWIDKSTVRWADQWSREEIEAGRTHDRHAKQRHYSAARRGPGDARVVCVGLPTDDKSRKGIWSWLSGLWSR